ncbi:hypothetical protein DSO57_1036689 [Entomophthora muscae]|uniref:Uncharacterized protein n=1 Tax=Entomophthora muscae TaxID=34485 RepID=A0ACC2SZE4_9FUNG|nr:hypothetical protein DSO57_1036689 [Entomophthora muscae]
MAGQQASNSSYSNLHPQEQLMGRPLQENQLFQQQQQQQQHQSQMQNLQQQSILQDLQLQQQMFQPLQNMPSQQPNHESPIQQDLFSQASSSLGPGQNSGAMPPSPFYGSMPMNSNHGVLNRANLQFEGNLEDMMANWSDDEKTSSRRLVQFWRRHENNTIFSRFQAISPADRSPNSIVISCIYWREKGHYVVTSVDCILLLEALIAVRFTVEEKNRIRRNLEGFRPLTIAKCKSDTADFFRLIMAFPNPKPRNIEKDVKVFPWRILSFALQKIVSKYAAGFTPSFGMNMPSFGGMSNMNSGLPSPAGPHGRMDSSFGNGFPVRANMQRRFSQPINSMNMGRYHPYSMGAPPVNRFASNFSSRQPSISEIPDEFNLKEIEANVGPRPPSAQSGHINPALSEDTSIASLNLETNFGQNFGPSFQDRSNVNFDSDFLAPGNSMMPSSFRQNINPRRHSLSDPYSLQRFQAMRLGINPMTLSSTGEEPPSGFDFSSNQGLGSLNNNAAFTIKEEDEFPTSGSGNNPMMSNGNSASRMRPANFYGGTMSNCNANDSNLSDSMAFLGNQGFNQLSNNGVYGNLNGMSFNMQSTSGEDSQIPPSYNS